MDELAGTDATRISKVTLALGDDEVFTCITASAAAAVTVCQSRCDYVTSLSHRHLISRLSLPIQDPQTRDVQSTQRYAVINSSSERC